MRGDQRINFALKVFAISLLLAFTQTKSFLKLYETGKQEVQKQILTVGVLTIPATDSEYQDVHHHHYIIEMNLIWMLTGGMNPVAIPYNATDDLLYALLRQVNGIYFTGGDLDLFNNVTGAPHPYTVTAKKIFEYAKTQNDNHIYFPIFGVCQGHELLHLLVADNISALGWSEGENVCLSTNFSFDMKYVTRLFSSFSDETLEAMQTQEIMMHLHHRGIPVDYYQKYPTLAKFFRILSTNNIQGREIVSTAEALKYPFYITQYHPEAAFDPVSDMHANHQIISFKMAQSFANFYASQCDVNDNQFSDQELLNKWLVKNGYKTKVSYIEKLVNVYAFDY
ncbi:gamma-glutamyl hydrolase a-like [Stylonychia lemnae]|uniref:folate gamma-glutamyl hydrolase n=1 Tax=Stylonychia lemnae TaxID=5949 RepID=A0A078AQI7_STYLE|nr:gamma-glutamyl hydrolase a-like [Stylonychia lemnae]|eukprot:CDW84429.1 gamma-glutamyl hydrolase a-like [Stylonychia lemnae]